MEIPELVEQRLEGEQPRSVVNLGGEDVAVFTRDRTLVYRAEGLLSDAAVEVYGHDIERLSVSPGRRKTTFVLESVAGTDKLSVADSYAEAVLERLLGGILETAGILDDNETVRGTYLFSDLTVVVTDARLVKHIGRAVWDSDYEVFPFASVTGLDFEEGQVGTQVVLWVEGRAQRIKAPNEEAPLLRRTLTQALCDFHGVDSLEQLNETVARADDDPAPNSSIVLEEGISPLIETSEETDVMDAGEETDVMDAGEETDVTGAGEETDVTGAGEETDVMDVGEPADVDASDDDSGTGTAGRGREAGDIWTARADETDATEADTGPEVDADAAGDSDSGGEANGDRGGDVDGDPGGDADANGDAGSGAGGGSDTSRTKSASAAGTDIERLEQQVTELTRAIERQNELLERQTEHLAELADRMGTDGPE